MATTLDEDFQQHMNWMQSMISDPSGAANAAGSVTRFSSQLEDLIATIASPPVPEAPRPSVAPSPLTPGAPPPVIQYRISDVSESGEEYYVSDASEIRGQQVPEWTRSSNLLVLLQKQQSVDPGKIFTNFQRTCDLTALFAKKKQPFTAPRGESGAWDQDGLTPTKEIDYKRRVELADRNCSISANLYSRNRPTGPR
jgi:hypothetical protein